MSYDVNVHCSRCGHDLMEGRDNMTSNLAAMWNKAGYLKEWPEDYRDLEPSNGWGDLSGCIEYLERIRDAICREPFAELRVSH